ncbi:LOW QUALITY PROTEIN: acyl-CoA dehydrogenase [Bipolaris maydis]|nr:LOW QUALITY PROTEIN: acyl-CoA dehydrogenase [Bipolaris maydis]
MNKLYHYVRFLRYFGSTIPYAEPPWAQGKPSPYYNDSHRQLRSAMRDWVEKELMPVLEDCEASAQIPDAIYQKAAVAGVLMPAASDAWIPQEWRGKYPVIEGIAAHQWNGFHDFILHDEFGRVGGIGFENAVIPVVLSGQGRISLAITEPTAGSDVQGIQTNIQPSQEEGCVIIEGSKKWITGGMYASFFLTLAKEQSGGFTLIVVPLSDRVSRRHITMSGSGTAGAAFAEVPIQMIVGERGNRLKYTMSGMQALRWSRVCLEDAIGYALKRETFGKKLLVICYKVAHMARQVESLHSCLIYQFGALSKPDQDLITAGPTATFKAHAGLVLEYIAVQIVGEIGLTRGGQGVSEEILLDLGIRRAPKAYALQSNHKALL